MENMKLVTRKTNLPIKNKIVIVEDYRKNLYAMEYNGMVFKNEHLYLTIRNIRGWRYPDTSNDRKILKTLATLNFLKKAFKGNLIMETML